MSIRQRTRGLLVVLALVPLGGCMVVTLQPLYDEKSVEFDEALPGVWVDADGESTLTVERGAWNAYDLTYKEGSDTTRLLGHLTRVGQRIVLDTTVAGGVEIPMVTLRAHWPFLLDHQGDTLTIRSLDYDWVKGHMAGRQLAPLEPVIDGDQNIVLTASTQTLRDWIAQHVTAAGVWEDAVVFKRQTGK